MGCLPQRNHIKCCNHPRLRWRDDSCIDGDDAESSTNTGKNKSWTSEGLDILPFALFAGAAFTIPYAR